MRSPTDQKRQIARSKSVDAVKNQFAPGAKAVPDLRDCDGRDEVAPRKQASGYLPVLALRDGDRSIGLRTARPAAPQRLEESWSGLPLPLAPVRGVHVDPLARTCVDPSAEHTTAWKHESMRSVAGDDGELKIAVEGRTGYRLPHVAFVMPLVDADFDLDQAARKRALLLARGCLRPSAVGGCLLRLDPSQGFRGVLGHV